MRQIKFRFYKPSIGFMKTDSKTFVASDLIEEEDWKVMQFTGLLDKNGKEIYDGDIITFIEVDEDSCCGREDTHTGVVKWIDEIAQWRFVYPSGQRTELYLIIQLPTIKSCEVIGNVFENHELLSN